MLSLRRRHVLIAVLGAGLFACAAKTGKVNGSAPAPMRLTIAGVDGAQYVSAFPADMTANFGTMPGIGLAATARNSKGDTWFVSVLLTQEQARNGTGAIQIADSLPGRGDSSLMISHSDGTQETSSGTLQFTVVKGHLVAKVIAAPPFGAMIDGDIAISCLVPCAQLKRDMDGSSQGPTGAAGTDGGIAGPMACSDEMLVTPSCATFKRLQGP